MNTHWSIPSTEAVTNAINWLEAATDDVRSARHKLSDRHLRSSPSVVTDNQQASEKAAKSWLAWHQVPYEKIEAVGHSTVGALAVLASHQFDESDLATHIISHTLSYKNTLAAFNIVDLTLTQRKNLRRVTKEALQRQLPSNADPQSEQAKPVTLDEWRRGTSQLTPDQVRSLIDVYESLSMTLYSYIGWIPRQWIDLKPLTNEDIDFKTWLHDSNHVGLPTRLPYRADLLPDQISNAYSDDVLEALVFDLLQKYPRGPKPSQIDMKSLMNALVRIQLASTWLLFAGIITDLHVATSRYPSDVSENERLGRQHYDQTLGVMRHIESITTHTETTIESLRSLFHPSHQHNGPYLK